MSTRMRSSTVIAGVLALLFVLALGTTVSPAKDRRVQRLPEQYQRWLEEVDLLITKPETEAFLELEEDYQRDAFIRRFWEAREPAGALAPGTFKSRYYARRAEALDRFGPRDERSRIYVLNGEPGDVQKTDCGLVLWPIEIWRYGYSEHLGRSVTIIFYQPSGGGPFRIFRPIEGYDQLIAMSTRPSFVELISQDCAEDSQTIEDLLLTFQAYEVASRMGPVAAEKAPEPADPEWLQTFRAFSTDAPASSEPLTAELAFSFPGRHQSRIRVQGRLAVPEAEAGRADLGEGSRSYNFLLNGEILLGENLFESFRYRFDLPVREPAADRLPLVFERNLRPGAYRLVVKLEDLNSGKIFRRELDLEVPAAEAVEVAAGAPSGPLSSPPEDAAAGAAALELVSEGTELKSGLTRFSARITGGEVHKVSFLLDDRAVLTKTRPPFSVELDLGSLPMTRTVRAVAVDAAGAELATDEVIINPGEHSFLVRLVEPRRGERYSGTVRVRAEVAAPEGALVERLEVFLGEDRVATLYQPPYDQTIALPDESLAFVRAVAYLEDGNTAEDLVVFNAADFMEDVSVRLVELYATVFDRAGRPLADLRRADFEVLEDGAAQEIVRFERLDDMPIYAALLVDTSASMAENLDEVRRVALEFFQQTLTPRDRGAVITFSDRPRLAAKFTGDLPSLAGALGGLTAERSTALWDSVVFGLYYFRGLSGQRALVVLSDGEDRRSEKTFEEALDFARSTGATVYAIGLARGKSGRGRDRLVKLAEETGGRSFSIRSVAELGGVCAAIQQDLRSRYLLAYYPPAGPGRGFRAVEVRVAAPGAEVRAPSGYYP